VTAERGQALRALAGDQRLESGVEYGGFHLQSAQTPGLREEAVIDVEGGAHMHQSAIMMQICQTRIEPLLEPDRTFRVTLSKPVAA
jgi:hypothetical protein